MSAIIWISRSANKDLLPIQPIPEATQLPESALSTDIIQNTLVEGEKSDLDLPSDIEKDRRQWLRDSISSYEWNAIAPGVELAKAEGKWKTNIGDSYLYLLRADPELTEFVIHSAKQSGHTRTAKQWCESEDLVAAMNAGMYQADHATNLGFMKIGEFVNQSRISNDNLFIAFGSQNADLPPAQVIDRDCHDWESLIANYEFVTQSIRMMDCTGKNRWKISLSQGQNHLSRIKHLLIRGRRMHADIFHFQLGIITFQFVQQFLRAVQIPPGASE